MIERIVDLSAAPAYVSTQHRQLVIKRSDEPAVTIPMCEVAAVVLSHPQVRCTLPAIVELMNGGGALIVCSDHQPVGMMLPLLANSLQSERFAAQAAAPAPLKKRLWQQVVRHKIRAQAQLLQQLRGGDHGLEEIAKSVRSGDASNREAVASRRYWPVLFGDPAFRRRVDSIDANRLLNYGYAVLRALVGRAVCGAGLHPSLGIHHHNRYNPYCLADDLMEPYRPLVDAAVAEHIGCHGADAPLDGGAKKALLEAMLARYRADGEIRTLFDIVAGTAASLARVFLRQSRTLEYPTELSDAST